MNNVNTAANLLCRPDDPLAFLSFPTLTADPANQKNTLTQKIRNEGVLTLEEALDLLDPVIQSLSVLHAQEKVHGYVSPDTILLHNGETMLMEPPQSVSSAWPERLNVLKPGYAASEQYTTGCETGTWTDVYGLSAVFYFCLTGAAPDCALNRVIAPDSDDCIHQLPLTCSLQRVLADGMALKPSERTATIHMLAAQLHKLTAQHEVRIPSQMEIWEKMTNHINAAGQKTDALQDMQISREHISVQPRTQREIWEDLEKKGLL